jgi:hypothetical protein
MEHTSSLSMHSSRPGFLAEVTLALLFIRDRQASGRLSLRNAEQFGITHLYFNEARLIHVTGDKRDAEGILTDLLSWTKGSVRFDSGKLVTFESLTWQQAQIFGRWLAFLEMRGIMQGIAQERLEGLARSMTLHLPGEPIALPDEVEYREEYEAEARARQWQRINEGARQLVERTLSDEQREQLKQFAQGVQQVVMQAGGATQDLARRAARATQEGLQRTVESAVEVTQEAARQGTQRAEELVKQALSREHRQQMLQSTQRTVESVAEVAQEAARQSAQRAEELLRQTLNLEKRQQIIQSMQETVESVKQSVGQKVEQAISQATTPLPPELQARSIRYRSMFRQLSEGQ